MCISSIIIIVPSNCKWGLIRINICWEGGILIQVVKVCLVFVFEHCFFCYLNLVFFKEKKKNWNQTSVFLVFGNRKQCSEKQ